MTYSDPASPPSYFAPPLDDKVNIAERPFFSYRFARLLYTYLMKSVPFNFLIPSLLSHRNLSPKTGESKESKFRLQVNYISKPRRL